MRRAVSGEVRFDAGAKAAYASDASNYRQVPVAVVLPRSAEAHGLTFAPDPATHSRCTLGGMVGNNSCGPHSVMAGKTVENIERLEVLTYDGARGTMCHSYRATREERYSTHARLLAEMLRGEVIEDGWASEDVREALDWRLGCKGCRNDCPTHTDMAAYKAEFMSRPYEIEALAGRPTLHIAEVLARAP